MYIIYDFIFLVYALLYLPYLLLSRRAYPGFAMRFGFFSPAIRKQAGLKENIWLHAVSVGEVMLLEGFIDRIGQQYPNRQLVLTVTTKTGIAFARERLAHKAIVIPSPLDFSWVDACFISLIKPKIYIAVETEVWPNLFGQLHKAQVPIAVINGRISDASYGRYKAIRFLLKGVFKKVSMWCMQSAQDAKRVEDLGAESSHIKITGNIKFDLVASSSPSSVDHLIGGYWWVAGSTHPGEEEIVLNVYQKIIQKNTDWHLVIAPRHVQRAPQIMEMISRRGLKAVKYSEVNKLSQKQIVVVDTIGHLRSLYALASLVFVGKSFTVGGGQNVVEPAVYGKAIIVGPRCENFRDIVACLKAGKAIVQVPDVASFESVINDLYRDESKREALGKAALDVIAANQGATQQTLQCIAELL